MKFGDVLSRARPQDLLIRDTLQTQWNILVLLFQEILSMVKVDTYTSFRFNNIGTTPYLERKKVGLCVRHVKYKYNLACRGTVPNSAHPVLVAF